LKAILLAAGKGTRLKPITDTIPKCLVKINGRPLLDYWFDILENAGVDDVLVNGYYMAEMTENHINSVRSKYPFKIKFVLENTLFGTGG
jgi:mannose-1-phosphate guanylyltransferase